MSKQNQHNDQATKLGGFNQGLWETKAIHIQLAYWYWPSEVPRRWIWTSWMRVNDSYWFSTLIWHFSNNIMREGSNGPINLKALALWLVYLFVREWCSRLSWARYLHLVVPGHSLSVYPHRPSSVSGSVKRQGHIMLVCGDAWKLVPLPSPSDTMYFNGSVNTSVAADARCGLTRIA